VSSLREPGSAENPFSTRRVRPGAIPYRFPPGNSAARLVERLGQNGWQGQIVGPHGGGKSALVATLVAALEQSGRRTLLVELHDRQRRLPVSLRRLSLAAGTVVIVDGYEQLARWRRFLLKRFCRRRGLGLVVTAHASAGLPDLYRTTAGLALAREIVGELLGGEAPIVTSGELGRSFASHQGNLREVLFDLYDLYESRRASDASTEGTDG
jgi:hypothetical protein